MIFHYSKTSPVISLGVSVDGVSYDPSHLGGEWRGIPFLPFLPPPKTPRVNPSDHDASGRCSAPSWRTPPPLGHPPPKGFHKPKTRSPNRLGPRGGAVTLGKGYGFPNLQTQQGGSGSIIPFSQRMIRPSAMLDQISISFGIATTGLPKHEPIVLTNCPPPPEAFSTILQSGLPRPE